MAFVRSALRVVLLFLIACAVSGLIGFIYHLINSVSIIYSVYMSYLIVSAVLMIFGVFTMLRGYHPGKNSHNEDTNFDPRWGVRNPARMITVGTVLIIIGLCLFFTSLYIESLLH